MGCVPPCGARASKKPHRRVRARVRVLAAAAAALLLAVIVYGQRWLLDAPATACVECAVTSSVARVLDGDTAEW